VHFAALKAVGESVREPLRYYTVNVAGTASLLRAMHATGVHRLVFSSSCTVYGDPERIPVDETCRREASNPYGRTKLIVEDMLMDTAASDDRWQFLALRYFNPVGAHASGRLGEDPDGIPNNLMPYIMQVATGRHPFVRVFGNDYPTPDGTPLRDYIHVLDLAAGHVAALEHLATSEGGAHAWNLGTGHGTSVLEVISAFERATGVKITYDVGPRRVGDLPASYGDPTRAEAELGWKATRSLEDMLVDLWRWQSQNPQGYAD
jgi:UDP-glucose 4-epimerase